MVLCWSVEADAEVRAALARLGPEWQGAGSPWPRRAGAEEPAPEQQLWAVGLQESEGEVARVVAALRSLPVRVSDGRLLGLLDERPQLESEDRDPGAGDLCTPAVALASAARATAKRGRRV